MTPYQSAIELAIGMAHVTTREQVGQTTFYPFQLLYVEMCKAKDLKPLSEVDEKIARGYWGEAKKANPEAAKFKQMWVAQSLYVYDLLTQK